MALKTDVVLALGCGVGKTAVIVLPSLVENGYTVVVIPLLSLLADWKHRCSKAGIPYEVWEGFKTVKLVGNCNLILATTDTAQGQRWETALMGLPRPVLRVVVEEAHMHATEIFFRDRAFSNSYRLRNSGPLQLVLASATLPTPMLDHFRTTFGLHPCTKILRTPAVQSNIKWIRHRPLAESPKIARAIFWYLSTWKSNNWSELQKDRFIVFVYNVEQGKELARLLRCSCYHSNSKNHPILDKERIRIMESWTLGKPSLLVSTTALSAGLDNPSIKLVFHVGNPPELMTFVQQSHRGGRSGYGASILIPATKSLPMGDPKKSNNEMLRLCGQPAMIHYAQFDISQTKGPQRCLHYLLSEFLDGIGKTCQKETCSGCISG